MELVHLLFLLLLLLGVGLVHLGAAGDDERLAHGLPQRESRKPRTDLGLTMLFPGVNDSLGGDGEDLVDVPSGVQRGGLGVDRGALIIRGEVSHYLSLPPAFFVDHFTFF